MAKNITNAIRQFPGESSAATLPAHPFDSPHEVLTMPSTATQETYGAEERGLPEAQAVQSRRYRLCKRWMDIGLVLLAGPLLLALFVVVAAIVRLSSKGPIFYKQRRIGRHGRMFTLYKFRTMKVDADQILLNHLLTNPAAHHEWMQKHKLSDDPRLTSCGRFLRTASLDELPQIWNVLRGEMSLVGPRPIIWAEKERYGDRFRFYTAVVPGLTGLWQISGRCNVSYAMRIRLDEQYVCEWTLGGDWKILLKTPGTVCRREGAY